MKQNDLDLDLICQDMIHADLSRLKETPGVNVSLSRHGATPHDAFGSGGCGSARDVDGV